MIQCKNHIQSTLNAWGQLYAYSIHSAPCTKHTNVYKYNLYKLLADNYRQTDKHKQHLQTTCTFNWYTYYICCCKFIM